MTTKTIGTSARDYATISLWESYLTGQGTLTVHEIGECYNDTEFDEAILFSGFTTSSTATATLRPATGQGFRDNTANALRYDQGQGVGVRKTDAVTFAPVLKISVDWIIVKGMQFKSINNFSSQTVELGAALPNVQFDSNIVFCAGFGGTIALKVSSQSKIINCLLMSIDGTPVSLVASAGANADSFFGCTIVRPSDDVGGGNGIVEDGNTFTGTIRNCAVFNFTNATQWGPDTTWTTQEYCATDTASFPAAVTGGVTSLTYASQFVNPSNATPTTTDFKAKSTGGLKAGTPDSTNTPVDIFGTTRDATTPYIGCHEVAVADVLMAQACF